MTKCKVGYVSSIYNGSAVDGDGIRCVIFFSGCNLSCPFCHNIETLKLKGEKYTSSKLLERILRYKNYIVNGGVTLSGGEPFLQAEFSIELVKMLLENGINTVIETNGHIVNKELIGLAEYMICDIKNQETDDLSCYYEFLSECEKLNKKVELTNVLVPSKNDTEEKIKQIKKLKESFSNIKGFHFLPFSKLSEEKYKKLNLDFPYKYFEEANSCDIIKAEKIMNEE